MNPPPHAPAGRKLGGAPSNGTQWLARLAHWCKHRISAQPHQPQWTHHGTPRCLLAARVPLPSLDRLGAEHPPYSAIFERSTLCVDAEHQAIADLPLNGALIAGEVAGFLRPADAMALFELAYFAAGDILEFGSAWGLSTSVLGRAIRNSGRSNRVASIEWDPDFQRATARTMQCAKLSRFYDGLAGPAHEWTATLVNSKRRFGLVFVDHDHSYDATRQVCAALPDLLTAEGIAVFHDFNDERNRTETSQYGIYQAVSELSTRPDFAFVGVIGCCGLVQRRTP